MFLSISLRYGFFISLVLAMFTKFSFGTIPCTSPKVPLTYTEAVNYKTQICYNQVVISSKYRIDGGGSIQCTSNSQATTLSNDPSPLTQALCKEILTVSLEPIFETGQECRHGYRLATVAEVSEPTTYDYLCNAILPHDDIIAKLEGGGSFRGFIYDPIPNSWECPISPTETASMGNSVCMPFGALIIVSEIVSITGTLSCTSPCITCSGSSDYCTSCTSPYPILHNNDCLNACPPQTYESGGNCLRKHFLTF